jgi:putative NADH-flavin reductase
MADKTRSTSPARIAVLGAGGRAGQAITAEAIRRGYEVVAIVRDPQQHPHLAAGPVTVVTGDALDARSVAAAAAGCVALVSAVTPFTAPPASFDGFDTGYYERVADALLAGAVEARVGRVVVISLFATLHGPDGRMVLEDPALFPPALRPFAAAHAAGITRLEQEGDGVDWLALAPPPQLLADTTRTGRYEFSGHDADLMKWARPLSYADLAVAVIDQITQPTWHRKHLAVYGT